MARSKSGWQRSGNSLWPFCAATWKRQIQNGGHQNGTSGCPRRRCVLRGETGVRGVLPVRLLVPWGVSPWKWMQRVFCALSLETPAFAAAPVSHLSGFAKGKDISGAEGMPLESRCGNEEREHPPAVFFPHWHRMCWGRMARYMALHLMRCFI